MTEIKFGIHVEQWDIMQGLLAQALVQQGVMMAKIDDLTALVGQLQSSVGSLGSSLANIADDISRISDQLAGGVSSADADRLIGDLGLVVSSLQGAATEAARIAAITPEPSA